ncbi:MAG: sulfurtransferase-like selenium metabolism protein YedF [Desulfobulbus sp.]|nr:MAG: sulfurtransferase-like selenium metabolism protein YedF [Desulfobulbus sp.]
MKVFTVDCRGLECPQPVIQTKDALDQGHHLLEVIVDNEASKGNVTRFARSRKCEVTISEFNDGSYKLLLKADGNISDQKFDAEEYNCPLPSGDGLVYVVSSASMGRGSDELGWALLQTYIQTIKDVDPLPAKILFYNEGVRLVAEESGALEALRGLQSNGVEILACGTCLDYFKLTSAIKVGQISNMYDIMSSVNNAGKVVSPF